MPCQRIRSLSFHHRSSSQVNGTKPRGRHLLSSNNILFIQRLHEKLTISNRIPYKQRYYQKYNYYSYYHNRPKLEMSIGSHEPNI